MRPILFEFGELVVPSFWAMAFTGFFMALLVVRSESKRLGHGVELAYDMVLYAYIGGWVGARLFLIPTGWDYFTEDPIGFLLSGSGWVWYGGVVGGAVAIAWLAHRRQISLLLLGDIAAPALALGLGIGRIGCQLAGDGDYGVATTLPWGMSYPDGVVPTTERVHPTPIYELVLLLIVFVTLWRQRFRVPPGHLLGQYLVYSGVIRLAIEFVRRNPAWIFGLTTAQWFSLASVALGLWLMRRATASGQAAPERAPLAA